MMLLEHDEEHSFDDVDTIYDRHTVIRNFLSGTSLQKVFSQLCNSASSGQALDPISDVAYTMLTCPIQMMISEVSFFGCSCLHASSLCLTRNNKKVW